MLPAQLKMRMCNLGIVFWTIVGNRNMNSPMRTHNARNTALCISVQTRGPNKGTKQTSGHDCSLFKGAPQTVQHKGCEIPEHIGDLIWSDCSYFRGEWVCQKLHSPFLIQNSISQLHVPQVIHQTWLQFGLYCFQSPNLSHKGQRHVVTWNSWKMCYRLERIHQKEGVKVFWVTLGMHQRGMWCWCFVDLFVELLENRENWAVACGAYEREPHHMA